MNIKKIVRKTVVGMSALMCAVFAVPAGAHAANAENVVIFGDSLFANPTYAQVGAPQSWGLSSNAFYQGKRGSPSPQGCPQGDVSVGNVLKRTYNHNVVDFSCSAAKSGGASKRNNFTSQSMSAVNTGVLNANTTKVLVQFGANDAPGILLGHGADVVMNSSINTKNYYQFMSENISRIKRAAPNAEIVLVSYPALAASNGAFCPVRTNIGADTTGTGFNMSLLSTISNVEKNVNSAMYNVARGNGVSYFNLSSTTKANNSCAPNSNRYIAGALETGVSHNLAIHYTHKGAYGVANILNRDVL